MPCPRHAPAPCRKYMTTVMAAGAPRVAPSGAPLTTPEGQRTMAPRGGNRAIDPSGHEETFMLNPGDTAPDFTGRDERGNTVKLSDFKGKPVVLWFFPKADTPG